MARSQWVLVGFVFALAASTAGTALAQQTDVIVLEVRSVEGDDDFAHNLSRAIRQAAGDVEGWNVTSREVSLTQMALAFGCEGDEPDAACMSQIASDLQMGGIIYGTIQRTSASSPPSSTPMPWLSSSPPNTASPNASPYPSRTSAWKPSSPIT